MSLRTVMDGVAKMRSRGRLDVRFSMPLYTQAEAARYLGMSDSTFKYWTHAYDRPGRTGKIHHGAPIITRVQSDASSGASVPFIGLAEAVLAHCLDHPILEARHRHHAAVAVHRTPSMQFSFTGFR